MRRKRGFTLIEVLVVVSIIALLASILLPSLNAARRSARSTKCKHNLHQLGVAMEAYLNRYKDSFPIACKLPSQEIYDAQTAVPPRPPVPSLPEALKQETSKSNKLFECPEDFVDPTDAQDYLTQGLDIRGRYFDSEKTSYEWNDLLSDAKYPRKRKPKWIQLYTRPGDTGPLIIYLRLRPCDLFMLKDFGSFHSSSTGVRNAWNELRADMSIRTVY
ncbi:MAG: type II secretion system protein [Planctomycetota bacterium]|nr:MAG: type II secretion system protein [Planctomycetota bacterium]